MMSDFPDLSRREEIEALLLNAIQDARRRHAIGECGSDEVAKALKRFNDFMIKGIIPDDLKRAGG
jgi:hypothetical protein